MRLIMGRNRIYATLLAAANSVIPRISQLGSAEVLNISSQFLEKLFLFDLKLELKLKLDEI